MKKLATLETPSIQSLGRGLTERRGFARDDGEFVEGLRCVAAPIRDQDGVVIASIGISAPQSRFPKSLYAVRGKQVTDIARAISASIGA